MGKVIGKCHWKWKNLEGGGEEDPGQNEKIVGQLRSHRERTRLRWYLDITSTGNKSTKKEEERKT